MHNKSIIKDIEVKVIELPLKKQWKISLYAAKTRAHAVLKIITEDGIIGYGESSPSPAFMGETGYTVKLAVDKYLKPALIGQNAFDVDMLHERMNAAIYGNYAAKSTVDIALYDIMGKVLGVPVYKLLGGKYRLNVELSWVVGIQNLEDAISIEVDIINAIEFKLKREINPFEPAVISIGKINSTGRYNIICDRVEIEGTIRTLYEETRSNIHTRIKQITEGITTSYGGDYEIVLNKGYDPVINNPALVQNFVDHSIQILGKNNVKTNITASLIGEDFSSFCKYVPLLYFHLGCDSEYPLHSDKFFAKEETIKVALELLGSFLLNYEK